MKKVLFLFTILLISCAGWNSEIEEFFTDYFPLEDGMKWVYLSSDGEEVVREVLEDSAFSGSLNMCLVEMMGEIEHYIKAKDATFYTYTASEYSNNNEIVLEKSNLVLFYQPLLTPQTFADTISKLFLEGDTISYLRLFRSRASEGNAERRKNVDFSIFSMIEKGGLARYSNLYVFYELAPDTGPVYILKVVDGDTVELRLVEFLK
ncbi:MAG TPA: hypothetical protein PLY38_05890 [Candidatus Hydrothermia bacterium]|nr:hypothetical protein [Candidatus Hydrothermae bacterium]MDD3649714.1 hypothetical protein [Candidatus Hydrothermia bacterium]HRD23352.1 hypothetical protein [Candidatus Hydrothermia bacterium]